MFYLISLFLLIIDFFIVLTYDLRYFLAYLFESRYKKYIKKSRGTKINTTIPIIVPIKNEPVFLIKRFLFNFLRELKKHPYKKFILIFVDDSDVDRKKEYIKMFMEISKNFFKEEIGHLEIYEFKDLNLCYIYRKNGIRRKGAAIQDILELLKEKNIEFFATYDIEWTIHLDYLYKAAQILKRFPNLSFVSWNRRTIPWSFLHKALNLITDYFFEVSLSGRQMFNEPVMYHGSCALLRLSHVLEVGGFKPHITEDADLTIRFYLKGYRGLHIREWIEYGQNLPGNFNMAFRTYTRWIYGTQNVLLKYLNSIIKSKKLNFFEKLSFVHMFTHFFTFMFVIFFLLIGYLYIVVTHYPTLSKEITFLFYFIPLVTLSLQWIILYIAGVRMYKDYNPLLPVIGIIIAWGTSVIAIKSLIKNLIGYNEPWIVTVKVKKVHRIYKDVFIAYFFIFIVSIIYFIYNLPHIAFTTFSIWILSLILSLSAQIKHFVKI